MPLVFQIIAFEVVAVISDVNIRVGSERVQVSEIMKISTMITLKHLPSTPSA